MRDQNITVETAILALNKGFVVDDGIEPTQSLLAKWLRKVHNIHVYPVYIDKGYEYYINTTQSDGWYETYELALEAGLQEALKQIKL